MVANLDRIRAAGARGVGPSRAPVYFGTIRCLGLGALMKRYHVIRLFVCAGLAALCGTAFAQDFKPSINLNADGRPLTQEEKEKRKAVDEAYRSTMGKLPEQKKSTDPWGNLRSPAPAQSKQRQ